MKDKLASDSYITLFYEEQFTTLLFDYKITSYFTYYVCMLTIMKLDVIFTIEYVDLPNFYVRDVKFGMFSYIYNYTSWTN